MPGTGFIDHIGIGVPDLVAAKEYYDDLMSVLGLREWFDTGPGGPLNYGPDGAQGTQLFFYQAEEQTTYSRRQTGLHHLAFLVASRAVVREAHEWAPCTRRHHPGRARRVPSVRAALLCDLLARSSWNQARGGLPQPRRELRPAASLVRRAERRRASGSAGRRSVGLGGSRRARALHAVRALRVTTLSDSRPRMGCALVNLGWH